VLDEGSADCHTDARTFWVVAAPLYFSVQY